MDRIVQFFAPAGWLLIPLVACAFGIWFFFLRSRELFAGLRVTDPNPDRALRSAERHVGLLAACTAVAPLLGLLGTVTGMMVTFDAVGHPGAGSDIASQVSGGISSALLTTQIGLVVAIPGVFGVARLHRMREHARNRLAEGQWQ